LSQFKKYHPLGNLKCNILGISQSLKLRILKEKILPIPLNLKFTPNTLDRYGLIIDYCIEYPTNLILLSDSMSSGLRLKIVLRVPVGIEDNDGICGGKVDAESTSPRRQEEAEVLRVLGVEVVQSLFAQLALDAAVEPLEREVPHLQVLR